MACSVSLTPWQKIHGTHVVRRGGDRKEKEPLQDLITTQTSAGISDFTPFFSVHLLFLAKPDFLVAILQLIRKGNKQQLANRKEEIIKNK